MARFRLFLAARLPAAGADQDLQALLQDLYRLKPVADAIPADSVMQSITYCAFLHSIIAWLAAQLSTPDGRRSMEHVLLQSDGARQLQQRMGVIFAEPTNQRLLIAHIQQHVASKPGYVADLFAARLCREGLGAWTVTWAVALR